MKQNLLILFSILFAQMLVAQSVYLSVDTMSIEGTPAEFDVVGHSYIVNTSNQNLSIKWVREENDLAPGWESAVCDNNNCYPSHISTNVIPGGNPNIPVQLTPGDTSIIDVHVYPFQNSGRGTVKVCIYTVDNQTDPIGCMVYNVSIGLSSTRDLDKGNLKVFPNPSSDYFGLLNSDGVSSIKLYNMLGRNIRTYQAGMGKKYYIGDLPAGMYLASIIGKNGEVIKTTRVIKRFITP